MVHVEPLTGDDLGVLSILGDGVVEVELGLEGCARGLEKGYCPGKEGFLLSQFYVGLESVASWLDVAGQNLHIAHPHNLC